MLGAATFRLTDLSRRDIYDGDVVAEFECVEGGCRPSWPRIHRANKQKQQELVDSRDLQAAADILADDDEEDSASLEANANGNINVNYSGNETVSWKDILNKNRTYSFPRVDQLNSPKAKGDFGRRKAYAKNSGRKRVH